MSSKKEDVLHGTSASENGDCGRWYLYYGDASIPDHVNSLVCAHCDAVVVTIVGDNEVCENHCAR